MADKKEFKLEYVVKISPSLLYNYLTTPSGLSEWFSDDVNFRGEIYTFFWDGSEEDAKLITKKNNSHIKFQWLEDEGEDYFFEMRIQVEELTKDVSLLITDFAEEDELEEAKLLWDSQINNLLHVLGS